MPKTITALGLCNAVLVALGAASPLSSEILKHPSTALQSPHAKRADFGPIPDRAKVAEYCQDIDWYNEEQVRWVWNDWEIGRKLDVTLYNNMLDSGADVEEGQSRWLIRAANDVWGAVGKTGAEGCYRRDKTCLDNGAFNCPAMVRDELFSEWYYIFKAVQNFKDMIEMAHNQVTDAVIKSTLDVSSIMKDFAVEEEPNLAEDMMTYTAAAMTLFAGATEFSHPGFAMAASLLGGTASVVAAAVAEDPSQVDGSSFDQSIKTALEVWRQGLDRTLAVALGAGSEADWLALVPEFNEHSGLGEWTTPIGAFFRDGRFLIEPRPLDPANELDVTGGFEILTKGLVDDALGRAGYAILGVKYTDPDRCYSDHAYGHQWVAELPSEVGVSEPGRCVGLYRLEKSLLKEHYVPASMDVINHMQNKYGINIYDYYLASYKCATREEGVADVPRPAQVLESGKLPLCFYRTHCEDSYFDEAVNARRPVPWSQ